MFTSHEHGPAAVAAVLKPASVCALSHGPWICKHMLVRLLDIGFLLACNAAYPTVVQLLLPPKVWEAQKFTFQQENSQAGTGSRLLMFFINLCGKCNFPIFIYKSSHPQGSKELRTSADTECEERRGKERVVAVWGSLANAKNQSDLESNSKT
eukprot:123090-Pelagomonas_calceolata.AAC.4